MTISHSCADINGITLHYASSGTGKLLLFLHGFPEFWYVWRNQLACFGQNYLAVAPDLRGYNLSSKPTEIADYALPVLVADIVGLISQLGQQQAILVGHDWGGMVAWECARTHPELLEKLIIINAPHPTIFRHELATNPAQQAASAYIPRLRMPQAEAFLTADNYAALHDIVIAPGLRHGYFDEADQAAYMAAWAQPGAITAGLNYYRAADFMPGMALPTITAPDRIDVPTLVIWGEADDVLLPSNLAGLETYVSQLEIERVPAATHAIIHEKPAMINARIQRFLAD
jgi:epoxide hydrolase 4